MLNKTDIDKLIAEYDRVHVGPAGGARKLMVEAPIADVAPRAEVAREIFEEIEKKISSMKYNAKTTRKTVKIEELKEQVDWVLHEVVPQTLAELKKKYTEEKE